MKYLLSIFTANLKLFTIYFAICLQMRRFFNDNIELIDLHSNLNDIITFFN